MKDLQGKQEVTVAIVSDTHGCLDARIAATIRGCNGRSNRSALNANN